MKQGKKLFLFITLLFLFPGCFRAVRSDLSVNGGAGAFLLYLSYLSEKSTPTQAIPVWSRDAYIKAETNIPGAQLGTSVEIDGDRMAVGSYYQGEIYIYTRNSTGDWIFQSKIIDPNPAPGSTFGSEVAIEGNHLAAVDMARKLLNTFEWDGSSWIETPGSPYSISNLPFNVVISGDLLAVGVISPAPGSVYVYHYDGSSWINEAVLYPPSGFGGSNFGVSVDLLGNTLVVGGPYITTGGVDEGAIIVYNRFLSGSWDSGNLVSNTPANSLLGSSVAISDGIIVAGAPNNAGIGSISIFEESQSTWNLQSQIEEGSAGDQFGYAVSIDGDYLVVGAPNTNQYGEAYLYQKKDTGWEKQNTFTSDPESTATTIAPDFFGQSLSISGYSVGVGAYNDNNEASGVHYSFPPIATESADSGAVYTFIGK